MPLIDLSVQHGQSVEEAKRRLETAVHDVHQRLSSLIRQVTWSADRSRVQLLGVGFWVEMWVDPQAVHVTGDIPLLGNLLGSPITQGIKQIVARSFQKKLP